MYLETLPHFRLGATLVCQPLCEPLACVRGENEDGNFDVRGSADVKHNVYSESWSFMGQHTHRSANTQFGPSAQRSISFSSFHVRWHPLNKFGCVCVWAKCISCSSTFSWTAQSYWYRPRSDDLFHATAWRSNPIPTKLFQATEPSIFSKSLLLYLYSP